MKKVETQTAGKIGLVSAILMVFGSVVGIGIFFKNGSVFKSNNNISWAVLLSWIIAVIIAMCMALSFSQICSCKTLKNEGLGGWARVMCGNRIGRFTKISHPLVYYVVQTFSCLFFGGEAILNLFAKTSGSIDLGHNTTLYAFVACLGLILVFICLNVFANKFAMKFGGILSYIKFLPILAVILLGIIFGCIYGGGLWSSHVWNSDVGKYDYKTGEFNIAGLISCIPAILFAYEGYLVIGNVASDVENHEKNVPLAVVFGMIVVTIVNLGITIGCVTAGTGNVYALMHIIFQHDQNLAKTFSTIFSIFIFICILGVCNGMIGAGVKSCQSAIETGVLFKSDKLIKLQSKSPLLAGGIYYSIFTGIIFLATAIPSIILNTDQLVDHMSNALVSYFYLVYATTVFGGFLNSFTNKVQVTKVKGFRVYAIVAVIGAVFVFSFLGIYQNLIGAAINPESDSFTGSLGLFFNLLNKHDFYSFVNWQGMVIFWSFVIWFMAVPFINDLLIKFFDKENKQPLLWQNQNINGVTEKQIENIDVSK